MSEIQTYSQAGQDLWVLEQLPNLHDWPGPCRVFLDVGANHPTQLSNTKLLEERGWRGWLIDNDAYACALCREQRPLAIVVEHDAVTLDYAVLLAPPRVVDYLSLDIDHGSLDALKRILECGVSFRVATVEHDAYRFGDELRVEQRRLLQAAGYVLARADVGDPGWPFEDWWLEARE